VLLQLLLLLEMQLMSAEAVLVLHWPCLMPAV
jgi:hypothetical protein